MGLLLAMLLMMAIIAACVGGSDPTEPRGDEFASVSAGVRHTCGVKTDGTVACWGSDEDGEATPPDGKFASVSAGGRHTCGVRNDDSIEGYRVGHSAPSLTAGGGIGTDNPRHLEGSSPPSALEKDTPVGCEPTAPSPAGAGIGTDKPHRRKDSSQPSARDGTTPVG